MNIIRSQVAAIDLNRQGGVAAIDSIAKAVQVNRPHQVGPPAATGSGDPAGCRIAIPLN